MPLFQVDLPPAEVITLNEPDRLQEVENELRNVELLSFDTETTGLVRHKDVPLFFSVAWRSDVNDNYRRVLMPYDCLHVLDESFKDESKIWAMANAKFDMHMAANRGKSFKGDIYDVAVQHCLLTEGDHGLKEMHEHEFGWSWPDFKETFGPIDKKVGPGPLLLKAWREDRPKLVEYASHDALGTYRLCELFTERLRKQKTLWSLHEGCEEMPQNLLEYFLYIEAPYTKVLFKCERRGVSIDLDYLESQNSRIIEGLNKINKEAVQHCGRLINLGSTADVSEQLFQVYKIKPKRFTKGGKGGIKTPTVDESAIKYYADTEDNQDVAKFCDMVLEYRDLTKTQGTYIKGLRKFVDDKGLIHTKINQDIARTGRISSSEPNLTNIKRASEDKYHIRQAFVSGSDDLTLLVLDYEQLESRLLAAAANEKSMLDIFFNGWDPHMGNAANVFKGPLVKKYDREIPYEEFVKAQKMDKLIKEGKLPEDALDEFYSDLLLARSNAKTLGYGVTYGMKSKNLSRKMKCSPAEAQEMIDLYMQTYPAVQHFLDECLVITRETGYTFSYLGRRRYLPDIASYNAMDRWTAERQAMNSVIQGTAADVVKRAQILLERSDIEEKYGAIQRLQIHDELLVTCPKETADEALKAVKKIMENPFPERPLVVPLKTSGGKGPAWNKAKLQVRLVPRATTFC